jgi:hypothetical protein
MKMFYFLKLLFMVFYDSIEVTCVCFYLSRANDIVTRAHDIILRGHDIVTRVHDKVYRAHNIVTRAYDLKIL